jgi:hypothetical protein
MPHRTHVERTRGPVQGVFEIRAAILQRPVLRCLPVDLNRIPKNGAFHTRAMPPLGNTGLISPFLADKRVFFAGTTSAYSSAELLRKRDA